ncbi:MAG: metal ABC transporter substrate-binding protein [Planctomycetota bacterium]
MSLSLTHLLLAVLTACFVGCDTATPESNHTHDHDHGGEVESLKIVASVTDLGDLARAIGGEHVQVNTLAGSEVDPHYIATTPDMVRQMAEADLMLKVGAGMESDWLDELISASNNDAVQPGGSGHFIAADSLRRLADEEVDEVSVHPEGNPHFLLDPVEGVKVAARLRDAMSELHAESAADFEANFAAFRDAVVTQLYGETIATRIAAGEADLADFAIAAEAGQEDTVLSGSSSQIGGQIAAFRQLRNPVAVGDHDLWPYFSRRYGIEMVGYMESSPGVEPTVRQLETLISAMNERQVGVILTAIFFDPRHGRFVSERTGAVVLDMAHQAGSRPDSETYLDMTRYNAELVFEAIRQAEQNAQAKEPA